MRLRSSLWIAVSLLTLVASACVRRTARRTAAPPAGRADSIVRIAISLAAPSARVSGSSLLTIASGSDATILGSSRAGTEWVARPYERTAIAFEQAGGQPVVVQDGHALVKSEGGLLAHNGRRYRGSLSIFRQGDSLLVVNNLGVEDYLKGVVPLEIGARSANESAAVAAQTVAARSFTYSRAATRRRDQSRRYDLIADVSDQVYGGFDSEVEIASAQVRATDGMVLKFAGRVIEAVYSSSCGGKTAEPTEVWISSGPAYLRSVSDSIPGGGGYYCDIAPRPSWNFTFSSAEIVSSLDKYLRNYVQVNGRINWVEALTPAPRTASGRVPSISIVTNAGNHEVTGDRIRFILRPATGEILRSTRFELVTATETGAGVVRVEVRGTGYGHGVGMCQWGAIGRSRAGQDFRQILNAYYSGVVIENIDAGAENR